MGPSTATIEVAGERDDPPVRLFCTDSGGDGPPLLLLHGLAGHCGEWDALAARFTATHRVVAFDARGSGASTRRPGDVSRAAHVRDVRAVVDRFGLDAGRLTLVGQSMGGVTALLTAAAHPELVRALVLIEAGPDGPSPSLPGTIGAWLDSWPVRSPTPGRRPRSSAGERRAAPGRRVWSPAQVACTRASTGTSWSPRSRRTPTATTGTRGTRCAARCWWYGPARGC
ncbi:alpha/beta hydrolase [Streptomyces microflavus]|uniref:alpha/beta hydrolase n=1 Tax=Streptomyces microflavus TaxID=1919 RepID=UPI003649ED91